MMKKLLLIGLLAYSVLWVYRGILIMGFHRIVHNHRPGPCTRLPNIYHGAEDVTLIPGDKILITSGLRFEMRDLPHFTNVRTAVLLFDFNNPEKGVTNVGISGIRDINEYDFIGISSWVDPETGQVRIFIINHGITESVVELFIYDNEKETLFHQETIGKGDPNFRVLDNLVAVGPRAFYATNYLYMRSSVEMYLQLKWGSVVYFDGVNSQVATQERFLMANGIASSVDGRYIYMVHISGQEIIVFTRNNDNKLSIREKVPLNTSPDNIIVDPDNGDLWLGCHPFLYQVLAYLEHPRKTTSVSQVLRLKTKDGRVTDITEVMVDDGTLNLVQVWQYTGRIECLWELWCLTLFFVT